MDSTENILLIGALVVLYIFTFVFWLVMLIDAVRNRGRQGTIWIIVIAIAGFIGSLIYYFSVVRKRKRATPASELPNADVNAYSLGDTSKDDIVQY